MRGFPCSFCCMLAKSFQVDFASLTHTVMDVDISSVLFSGIPGLCAHHFVTSWLKVGFLMTFSSATGDIGSPDL